MRSTMTILLTLLAAGILVSGAYAQTGNGNGVCQFIDEDGDGFNDLAPDADGDGIPNGLDPDYVKPEDGTGYQHKFGTLDTAEEKSFDDLNGNQYGWGRYARMMVQLFGDGVMAQGPGQSGFHFGPGGDGTGLGSGFGPGADDGTGDDVDLGNRSQRRGSGQ